MALDFSACRRSFFFFIRAGLALSQFLPVATVLSHSLRHYLRAHGYKWAGPRATRARCRSLVDESHSTSARAAVGGDQDLILITCRYTGTRTAIDTDNANRISASRICRSRGTGRARLASFAPRTGWSRFPPFARWTCGTRFSLWPFGTLTAARQTKGECNHEPNAFSSHDDPRQFVCHLPTPEFVDCLVSAARAVMDLSIPDHAGSSC